MKIAQRPDEKLILIFPAATVTAGTGARSGAQKFVGRNTFRALQSKGDGGYYRGHDSSQNAPAPYLATK